MGPNQPMKRSFLTVYDYGQGGVWLVLLAESRDEVETKYPELTVVENPPASMSDDELTRIKERRTLDVDDMVDPFLKSLRESRAVGD